VIEVGAIRAIVQVGIGVAAGTTANAAIAAIAIAIGVVGGHHFVNRE